MAQEPTIITHGCRLNIVESETMRALASKAGLKETVIINTCAVTNEAVRSSRQSVRRARRDHPDAKLVVTGCAVQTHPDDFTNMAEVDAVFGNDEKLRAEEWQNLQRETDKPVINVNDIMSVRATAPQLVDSYGDHARAFLQVQNGCDHRCTFCIIPFGRGNSRSVPVSAVVEQAQRLVDAGHRELVITGVDITSYGSDLGPSENLGTLVAAILDQTPGLFRLRLSSIDGAEIDDQLFERICSDERIAPYMHISLQAGDNMILKRMKRRHTREQAIDLCRTIRVRRPEIAFGADIIAGFPTETEDMFNQSLAIIDEAGLQFVHVFPFSPRNGTPAAKMPQLPRTVIKERAGRLRAKATDALHSFLDSLEGQVETAVIESGGRARMGNFATASISPETGKVGDLAHLRIGKRNGDMVCASPA